MTNVRIRKLDTLRCCLLVLLAVSFARWLVGDEAVAGDQLYPTRVVRLIVPNTPGGPVDAVARLLADEMKSILGQPVVVENHPGAGGNIGTDEVAKADPDGHTLLFTPSAPLVVNRFLYRKISFDPTGDFAPIALVYSTPLVLNVSNDCPARTVAELVQHAKKNPGKLNYSTGGTGTPPHLAAELFKRMAEIDVVHIPYRGGTDMTMAVVKGEVSFNFNGPLVMRLVEGGKMKALAVTTPTRSALAPDLPTMAESGFPGFDVNGWGGLLTPARTPEFVRERLRSTVGRILSKPEVRKKMQAIGVDPEGGSSEELATRIRDEAAYWGALIKSVGIKAD